MKVAIVVGICVERDAISASAVSQAEQIAGIDGVDDVVLVAQHVERALPVRSITITDPWSLIRHRAICDADAVIFHWGIRYALFDALPLIDCERAVAIHFHNLTPLHLASHTARPVVEASERQFLLAARCRAEFWSESAYNLATLRAWGFDDERRLHLVPFPVTALGTGARPPAPDIVRLLTVGRFVEAKGLHVLVEAMASVVAVVGNRISLRIVGNAALSDLGYLERLRSMIDERGLATVISIVADPDDASLWREYLAADVLVSPSFHEGLCVPVIEAYLAGARVIGTDAGNLPFVVQPPDPVVPAGEVGSLADAIVDMHRQVLAGERGVPPGAQRLIDDYSATGSADALRRAFDVLVGAPRLGAG